MVGWFFFPFNDFEGVEAFGEYKNEAGAFFFMAGCFVLGIEVLLSGKILIPYRNKLFQILLLFFVWCFLTTLLNYATVTENYFKHTSGVYRFFRQYVSLLIPSLFFLIFFFNVIRVWTAEQLLLKIRKVLLISLLFVFVYGFIETLIVFFNINILRNILSLFEYFPFLNVNYMINGRISSVAYEAPSLGNYLITVSGWMFSYILTSKNRYRFIPTLMVLFLTFFSGSRTALINIGIQVIILLSILYSMPHYRKNVISIFKYGFIAIGFLLLMNGEKVIQAVDEKVESLNFSKNLKNNISNQSRFGMQYASLQVFKENPIIGVGFGQETYHKRFHYPGWAKKNNWEFKVMYQNNSLRSFPTAYNMYTRLLAEIGIVGVFIFLFFIFYCIKKSIFLFKVCNLNYKILGFILILSFTGLSLNWMQTDFFRQYGFWLCVAILISLLNKISESPIVEQSP
ncbi:O-antigen ligase family protein [Flavobacterium antarcticum]|uniref:O-antigen ligase family protein n=1 Tax=Flavobacterium antarcticum TaxID=271155 RepID=UPI000688EFDC|nr:O-antigen polymerase [Flavobacterium antarcticum]